jgi:hypothetical protein
MVGVQSPNDIGVGQHFEPCMADDSSLKVPRERSDDRPVNSHIRAQERMAFAFRIMVST